MELQTRLRLSFYREIAEITGLPLSTVLSKYNRALKKMKSKIEA